ncbi:MAG TPA: DUF5676 family membrane protein [Methylomirabilota bacterium]|jgi:hypothetical protein|nr:DUF5676 family membrane protein [Methylomirabilota bacterium]
MLNRLAFANSLAILTAALSLLFSLLAAVSPRLFQLLFNAQFFGADVAALLPKVVGYEGFVGTFLVLIASAWLFGYAWAWLYDVFAGWG